jgi:hypothetical protein
VVGSVFSYAMYAPALASTKTTAMTSAIQPLRAM